MSFTGKTIVDLDAVKDVHKHYAPVMFRHGFVIELKGAARRIINESGDVVAVYAVDYMGQKPAFNTRAHCDAWIAYWALEDWFVSWEFIRLGIEPTPLLDGVVECEDLVTEVGIGDEEE